MTCCCKHFLSALSHPKKAQSTPFCEDYALPNIYDNNFCYKRAYPVTLSYVMNTDAGWLTEF